MAQTVTCPVCDKAVRVPNNSAGKSTKCNACQTVFQISPGRKVCVDCGVDVSQAKRFKDAENNYYCAPCYAKRIGQSPGPVTTSGTTVAPVPDGAERRDGRRLLLVGGGIGVAMIAGLLVMYLTKSWEGEHGVEILTRQLRAKAQFEGGSLREGTQTLKGILELIGSRRLKDPELQEAFEFASRHPFFSKLDTLVSEGDSLLKSEDYEQAQERYSRVLKLIDPGEPLLAGIRLEVEGKLKSEEIAKGAQGLRRVGDQWLNDAQTKAWKEVEALAKDARKKIDLEYYSSAKTSLNAAIDLINGLPDKSHPEKSRIEELLNSNDVQKGSSGFKKFEGEWISPARFLEVMKARGLVEYKGKWVTPVEKETEIMTARGMVIFRDKWVTPDEKFALEQKEKGLVLWKGKWISEEEYRKVATGEVKGRVGIQLGSGRVVYMATDKIYLMKNRLRWAAGKSGFASLRKIESFGNAQSAFRSALNAGNVLYNIKTDFEGQYWGTGIPEGTYYYYCLWTQNVNNCIWTGQVSVKAGHVTTLDLTGQNLAEYYSSSR